MARRGNLATDRAVPGARADSRPVPRASTLSSASVLRRTGNGRPGLAIVSARAATSIRRNIIGGPEKTSSSQPSRGLDSVGQILGISNATSTSSITNSGGGRRTDARQVRNVGNSEFSSSSLVLRSSRSNTSTGTSVVGGRRSPLASMVVGDVGHRTLPSSSERSSTEAAQRHAQMSRQGASANRSALLVSSATAQSRAPFSMQGTESRTGVGGAEWWRTSRPSSNARRTTGSRPDQESAGGSSMSSLPPARGALPTTLISRQEQQDQFEQDRAAARALRIAGLEATAGDLLSRLEERESEMARRRAEIEALQEELEAAKRLRDAAMQEVEASRQAADALEALLTLVAPDDQTATTGGGRQDQEANTNTSGEAAGITNSNGPVASVNPSGLHQSPNASPSSPTTASTSNAPTSNATGARASNLLSMVQRELSVLLGLMMSQPDEEIQLPNLEPQEDTLSRASTAVPGAREDGSDDDDEQDCDIDD
ncbi:unnamed protein product [Amoebophrya sp. A25]|nr:unnamed protein product [Amoebophrya sp. A25]|eukprot:GSA25T00008926001.1